MKKIIYIILLFYFSFSFAQKEEQRIETIKNQLTALSVTNNGLTENLKTEITVKDIQLSTFLKAVAEVHKLNINSSNDLNNIIISPSFPDVTVTNLLVFLCKEHSLTIDFTGNILAVKKYQEPQKEIEERIIPITYIPANKSISIDAKGDKLYDVFKKIMDNSGKNLVFTPGLENKAITAYIQQVPFDTAMENLALANNLYVEKTKEGFYVFENNAVVSNANGSNSNQTAQRPVKRRRSNFFFKVIDKEKKLLEVNIVNEPIGNIINDIGNELDIDVFTASPLDNAGTASFKTKNISFDDLLVKIFEANSSSSTTPINSQNSQQPRSGQNPNNQQSVSSKTDDAVFTFKKEGNVYFFGTEKQLSVRKVEIVYLQYRSVELLSDPAGGTSSRNNFSNNYRTGNYGNSIGFNNQARSNNFGNNSQQTNRNNNTQRGTQSPRSAESKDLLTIVPEEVKEGLDFNTDYELNSFYVTGPSTKIERFKAFINQIDKPVPVVLIEVMIIEVSRNTTTDTGIEWGIGNEPVTTQGGIYPETDITLGAKTINKIIGGFGDFAGFNLGKVVPNFFSKIKLMESNGNFKILSTPKLATLNGHRATFSNGQTSYYTVTERSIIGADNPLTNEIVNYVPIEAELGLTIKPSVTGDGHVLLDINVIQSSFGNRIDADAPPDINSRTFTSIIRMQDQDIAILGGLEENAKNDSGSGVPFLARIPIIKYLFSRRTRTAKKSKLSVLIKPTVVY
ncbi:general secretion pathway protein GspD [uncultured Lacinutrix sp.]|uniref:type II secretion system protein GspD n=1 Tax=uncultured Lacinutrix sp. TaxID=574032 RepID=UPI0026080C8F|nr:general secretion pathway protein GspD [uncultured Lacinutrix sp.]